MSKRKLFLDFDSTIIDSIKAYCSTYNDLYYNHPDFKPALWYLCEQWNMKDQCPLVNNCNELFSHELFFKYAEFINPNTREVIEKLCNKYTVIVCTIGTPSNIALKTMWLETNLPMIKEQILLVNNDCKMDKSIVNMHDSIFIDDVVNNLESSNALYKICFGEIYEWNKSWKGERCINWTDVEKLLI